jgi:hypothetical protein
MEYVSELRLVTDLVRSILFDRKRLKSWTNHEFN